MRIRTFCITLLSLTPAVYAVSPNPLENAYWRFEAGPAGSMVPQGPNSVLDTINANNLRWFDEASGSGTVSGNTLTDTTQNWFPGRWVGFLCAIKGTVFTITASTQTTLTLSDTPEQGAQNYAIFTYAPAPTYTTDVPVAVIPQTGAANTLALHFTPNDDIWTDGKNINNPIVDPAKGFTLEAAFKPEVLNVFQGIVGKDGQPTAAPEQTLVLKVRGDTNELQIELFDKSGTIHGVRSLAPLVANQWYYAAVTNDNTHLSLYLDRRDGAGYVLQGTDPNPLAGALWEGTDPSKGFDTAWAVGRGMYNNGPTDWFTGVIDEVRITNEVLDTTRFLFYQGAAQGDLNWDGKVDGEDVRIFGLCAQGPGITYSAGAPPPGCVLAPGASGPDFDGDGDVDQDDFAVLQLNYTG